MSKTILFDLDGTLTDSGEGIINCASLALERFGIPVPDRDAMRVFVGPPLNETFVKFGVPEDRVDEAIRIYRSRYFPIGKFENKPYPGIPEMLCTLKEEGFKLFIATSKPEAMAQEIAAHFCLDRYFDGICGATLDRSRNSKEDVIAYLLDIFGRDSKILMVGDTIFDINGANAHGIPAIGVDWGYGETVDMINAGAAAIAYTPEELLTLIRTL